MPDCLLLLLLLVFCYCCGVFAPSPLSAQLKLELLNIQLAAVKRSDFTRELDKASLSSRTAPLSLPLSLCGPSSHNNTSFDGPIWGAWERVLVRVNQVSLRDVIVADSMDLREASSPRRASRAGR